MCSVVLLEPNEPILRSTSLSDQVVFLEAIVSATNHTSEHATQSSYRHLPGIEPALRLSVELALAASEDAHVFDVVHCLKLQSVSDRG